MHFICHFPTWAVPPLPHLPYQVQDALPLPSPAHRKELETYALRNKWWKTTKSVIPLQENLYFSKKQNIAKGMIA